VIVAGDPKDYLTWEEREEPVRHEPAPERLEELIGMQLSEDTRKAVAKSLR
jgi:hypothetical protein